MSDTDKARIRWRCRRGIKELDVVMERFTAVNLPHLSPAQLTILERLLDETDADLLDWIIGRSQPGPPEYLPIVDMLRRNRS